MCIAMYVWMDWQCVVIVMLVIICSFACVFLFFCLGVEFIMIHKIMQDSAFMVLCYTKLGDVKS